MATDDERREVAARLRYVAEHGAPEWATTACCIAECIGEDDYQLWSGSGLLFSKLADLIEPEHEHTCHIVMASPGEWECSACGRGIDWDSYDEGDLPNCNYCPNCGAKVVEE